MKEKLNDLGLSVFKVSLTSILCLIGLLSTIYVAFTSNELFSYFYCIATVAFVALPIILMLVFHWKMNMFFYLLFTFYTFGPLLGAVYNFYYYTSWWDDLLHLLAGTVFAVVLRYTYPSVSEMQSKMLLDFLGRDVSFESHRIETENYVSHYIADGSEASAAEV